MGLLNLFMNRGIAKFEKVSLSQFIKDVSNLPYYKNLSDESIREAYREITLPKRSTDGSAGYDFVLPFALNLLPGDEFVIPTGIKCKIANNWFLGIFPRSGLGFKHRISIANTIGVIDSDYYYASNEGHIMVKLVYDGFNDDTENNKLVQIESGSNFVQGIFMKYGITIDDDNDKKQKRTYGFGSTDKNAR